MIYRPEPILRPMVWGSELWVLSGYPERMSVIAGGPCNGMTVKELVSAQKEALVGRECLRRFGEEFPLLIKFLDVHAPLSIQVHPSEEFAMSRQGLHGKTEMWYVAGAEPGTELLAGFSRDITLREYEERVADGTITDVIAHHKISPGDVFFLPPGRVHALLPGSYVAEIQQSSDSTYRIWDYGRPGLDGKLRPLHTELAAEVLDYKAHDSYRTSYEPAPDKEVHLVDCDYFKTSLLELTAPYTKDLSALDSFLIVICLEGSGRLHCGGDVQSLSANGCLLIPASESAAGFVPDADGLKLLLCHL